MTRALLALDQGTSSTRCIAFDEQLRRLGRGDVPLGCDYPAAGQVEQDPAAYERSAVAAIASALADAGLAPRDVAALAIANQTETFVVWERESGRPIHPAIVWQDRRTDAACAALVRAGHGEAVRARTGLELDATFPATKLRRLLEEVPGALRAAEAGELAYGDVGCWLVHRLGGGDLHVCDTGNAGRSLLVGRGEAAWDEQLLALFGIPRALLPEIADTDAGFGHTAGGVVGAELPIAAVAGDQQAALFGQRCFAPGEAKLTLGTGGFLLVQAGAAPPAPPPGVLASTAWRRAGAVRLALEGFIPVAGAAIDWLVELGILRAAADLDAACAGSGAREPDVSFLPALQGLGTPSWRAGARGTLLGLTRATTAADIARAAADGIAQQVADAAEAIGAATPIAEIRLDGGLSRSAWLAQRIADLTAVPVVSAAEADATAAGAALLGGLAAGVWPDVAALPAPAAGTRAEPALRDADRRLARERHARLVALAGG